MKQPRVAPVSTLLLAVGVIGTALVMTPVVSGQNVKESFTGWAINLNGVAATATVDFAIERWSTDAERNQLLTIIRENKRSNAKAAGCCAEAAEGRLDPDEHEARVGFALRVPEPAR